MGFSVPVVGSRLPSKLISTSLHSMLVMIVCVLTSVTFANAQSTSQKALTRPVSRMIASGPIPPASVVSRIVLSESKRSVPIASTPASAVSPKVENLERRAFELVNAQRKLRGLPALPWDAELARLARQHSENMARMDFFNHRSPNGTTMVDRARAQGLRGWKALGENIAYNQGYDDPAGFVAERWMISYKHRENLLNARWTRSAIGVAVARDGRVFFTQVFLAP